MKQKLLFLLTALMLLTTGNAWGEDVIETYNLSSWGQAHMYKANGTDQDGYATMGTTSAGFQVNNVDMNELEITGTKEPITVYDLSSRFAVSPNVTFRWGKGKNDIPRLGNENGSGIRYISIIDLKAGDRVVLTCTNVKFYSSNATYDNAGTPTAVVGGADVTSGTTYTITGEGSQRLDLQINSATWGNITNIVVTRSVECPAPTWTITGAYNTSRKFTLACETAGATIYYSETERAAGADGWSTYSSEVTTSASTIWAYASKSGDNSDVVSFATGAGTTIALNSPTISRTAATSVTITAPQSVLGEPTATIYYRIGDSGEFSVYSNALTVSTHNTVYAYAAANGYTNSSTVNKEVDFASNLTSKSTASRVAYSEGGLDTEAGVAGSAKTYYPLVVDGVQWGENIYFENAGWGFRGNNTWYNGSASSTTGYVMFTNLSAGDIVVMRINEREKAIIKNAVYEEKYSYPGYYAYRAKNEGNMELRFMRKDDKGNNIFSGVEQYRDPSYAIADCKQHETSAAFAEAIDAQSFSTAEEVYAFHTAWQIQNASSKEITKVIFDAQVSDFSRWSNARHNQDQQYTGAPDNKYFDAWNNDASDGKQKIYGLPAGTYTLKAATRASDDVTDKSKYNVWVSGGSANVSVLGHHDGNTGGELENGWSWTTLTFTLDATADVEIGFYSCPPAERWAGCDDFHLYAEGVPASLGTNGYATFASPHALDLANLPEGLTAYKASVSENTVTFTQVEVAVQANTGLLLKGSASGNYDIPVAASGTDISATNAFLVNEGGKTFNADDNFNYFGLKKNTLTFGLFNPATVAIPSNKAYLKIAKYSGARLTIVFEDDDPTAINTVEAAESEADALKDGKYLIGNKVVLVKNGVKYSANGQILK